MKIYSLLLLLYVTPCLGQVKSTGQKSKNSQSEISANEQPKMIRTQGVVSGNVGCELQDKAGTIWFSTSGEGVYRYDGKSFTNYTTKDGLSSNDVRKIIGFSDNFWDYLYLCKKPTSISNYSVCPICR
ncbi:MAG: hypothetical protein EAZ91_21260 [Cytophagales bacterium]|nr:MAG: hypothetical protein EAZ91_21260 [Cytophagales bacterium]